MFSRLFSVFVFLTTFSKKTFQKTFFNTWVQQPRKTPTILLVILFSLLLQAFFPGCACPVVKLSVQTIQTKSNPKPRGSVPYSEKKPSFSLRKHKFKNLIMTSKRNLDTLENLSGIELVFLFSNWQFHQAIQKLTKLIFPK